MVASMTKNEINRFVRICEDQGIGVTRTKKGLLLRFPDGTSTTQHFTNSDVRAEKNQIARFRRAGMVHPNDTRKQTEELPSYITNGTITQKTKEKIVNYVVQQGFPESVLASAVVKDLDVDPAWANRALFHTGFRPGVAKNRKIGRPWYTPENILGMRVDEEAPAGEKETSETIDVGPVTVGEPEPLASHPPLPSLDFVKMHGHDGEHHSLRHPDIIDQAEIDARNQAEDAKEREAGLRDENNNPMVEGIHYIDERESWVPNDMKKLLGTFLYDMLEDRLSTLRAVGINYELRVWVDREQKG